MKGTALIAVLLPLAVAFGLGASAGVSHALGFDGWFGLGARPAAAPAEPPLDRLERDLALRPDQAKGFREFRGYCECGLGGCKGRLAKARAELGRAILAEPADPERVEQARRELLEAYDEGQKAMVDHLLRIKRDLDAEQRKKFAEAFFPGVDPAACGCGSEGGTNPCGKCPGRGCGGR
jgi:hypothetical protein